MMLSLVATALTSTLAAEDNREQLMSSWEKYPSPFIGKVAGYHIALLSIGSVTHITEDEADRYFEAIAPYANSDSEFTALEIESRFLNAEEDCFVRSASLLKKHNRFEVIQNQSSINSTEYSFESENNITSQSVVHDNVELNSDTYWGASVCADSPFSYFWTVS